MIAQQRKSKAAPLAALLVAMATFGAARGARASTLVVNDTVNDAGACALAVDTSSTSGQAPYDNVTFRSADGTEIYLDPPSSGGAGTLLQAMGPGGLVCFPPPLTLCELQPSVYKWSPKGLPAGANQVTFSCCSSNGSGSYACNTSPPGIADPLALTTTVNAPAPAAAPAMPLPLLMVLAVGVLAVALRAMRGGRALRV
jgi:hypothetical protein